LMSYDYQLMPHCQAWDRERGQGEIEDKGDKEAIFLLLSHRLIL